MEVARMKNGCCKFRNIDGFTLVEVLITLLIIGVVAALTIPTLISNYNKRVTVTRLKSAYTQLIQAIELSENENDDISGWDFGKNDWFGVYLAPYMKCKKSVFKSISEQGAIPYLQVSGKREIDLALLRNNSSIVYTLLNGEDLIVNNTDTFYSRGERASIIIDINGVHSSPNQFGHDTFYFYLDKKHGLVPMGQYSTSEYSPPNEGHSDREWYKNPDPSNFDKMYMYGCNKYSRGMFCAGLIMADKWEIRDDYPW